MNIICKSLISILFLVKISYAQEKIIIIEPSDRSTHSLANLDGEIVIKWKAETSNNKVDITWSSSKDKWANNTIASKIESKKARYFWAHPFESPQYKNLNEDGSVYIRIKGIQEYKTIKIFIPELSSKGKIKFNLASKQKKYTNILQFTLNGKEYPMDQFITLVSGTPHRYKALVEGYGEKSGSVVVKPGEKKNHTLILEKTWGEILYTSKIKNFEINIKNRRTGDETKYRSEQKKIALPKGKYTFTASKEKYRNFEVDFEIDPQEPANVNIQMVKQFGSVYIDSDPSGAIITLDGKNYNQKTPFELDSLSPGTYECILETDGYRRYTTNIKVNDNKTTTLYVDELEKKVGTLYIEKRTRKQEITLTVDGKEFNYNENNDYFFTDIQEGTFDIKIGEYGYEIIERNKTIRDRQDEYVENIEWRRLLVPIDIPSYPRDTELFFTSKDHDDWNGRSINQTTNLKLPMGFYKIRARAPKHEKGIYFLKVERNGGTMVIKKKSSNRLIPKIDLQKKSVKKARLLSIFPGAGLVYAEKQKLGLGVMAGTLSFGSFFLFSHNKYITERDKLDVLQEELMLQTNIEDIQRIKKLRNAQSDRVNNISLQKDISGIAASLFYSFNIVVTFGFHGL